MMQVPLFHGHRDQEAAEEQVNQVMSIGPRHGTAIKHAEQGKQQDRQQRRGRHRDRLGQPPDRHQRGSCGYPLTLRRHAVGRRQQQDTGKQQRPGQQADKLAMFNHDRHQTVTDLCALAI